MPLPEQLVTDHADFLYQYARSRLRDEDAAGDAVQETFLAALERPVGSSRVDLQACKLEYSIVSPK